MSSNVVQLDQRASARLVSAEVKRQYLAERSKREVSAIRRNRIARLVTTKRWWLTMLGVTTIVSMSVGASAHWWWQQSTTILGTPAEVSIRAKASAPATATEQNTTRKQALPNVVATGSPPIPSSQSIVIAPTPVGRMPLGNPMAGLPPNKQVVPAQPTKPPARTEAAVVVPSTQKSQLSTQYEATVATASKVQATVPVSVPTSTTSLPVVAAASAPAPVSSSAYQVIGVPVDGVLQIRIGKDPAIRPIRVGERLPSGEVLRRANSDTGQVETSERSFKVN